MLHYTNICYILTENFVVRLPKLDIRGFSRPPSIAYLGDSLFYNPNPNRNRNQNPNRITILIRIPNESQSQSNRKRIPNPIESQRNLLGIQIPQMGSDPIESFQGLNLRIFRIPNLPTFFQPKKKNVKVMLQCNEATESSTSI